MARFFIGAGPDFADAPRILRRSLFRSSIRSLIAAARLSWLIVRSIRFIGSVNIQTCWNSSAVRGYFQAPKTEGSNACEQLGTKFTASLSRSLSVNFLPAIQGNGGGVFFGKVESYVRIGGDGLERYIHQAH